MSKRTLPTAMLALVVTAAVAGCGSKGSSTTTTTHKKPTPNTKGY